MWLLGCRLVWKRVNGCMWWDLEPPGVGVCDRLMMWSSVWWCGDVRMNGSVGSFVWCVMCDRVWKWCGSGCYDEMRCVHSVSSGWGHDGWASSSNVVLTVGVCGVCCVTLWDEGGLLVCVLLRWWVRYVLLQALHCTSKLLLQAWVEVGVYYVLGKCDYSLWLLRIMKCASVCVIGLLNVKLS